MTRLNLALVLLAMSGLAGCRQADGTVPASERAEMQGDIRHVAKDILNVAGKSPDGPKELGEDLRRMNPEPEAEPQVMELTQRLVSALQAGSKVEPARAQELADALWQGIGVRDLSHRQSAALQGQVKAILVASGVSDQSGQSVAGQLGEVQKLVTRRPKKWYEVF